MYRKYIKDDKKMEEIQQKKTEKKERLVAEGRVLGGRPKTKLEELPEGWGEKVVNLMKEGASILEVRAEVGIGRDLWDRMYDEEEEFRKVIDYAKELSEAWWMNQARSNLYNHKFQTVLWYMNMKNRFGWKDKAEVDYTSGGKAIQPQIMVFGINDPLNKRIQQVKDEKSVPLQLDSGTPSA